MSVEDISFQEDMEHTAASVGLLIERSDLNIQWVYRVNAAEVCAEFIIDAVTYLELSNVMVFHIISTSPTP